MGPNSRVLGALSQARGARRNVVGLFAGSGDSLFMNAILERVALLEFMLFENIALPGPLTTSPISRIRAFSDLSEVRVALVLMCALSTSDIFWCLTPLLTVSRAASE